MHGARAVDCMPLESCKVGTLHPVFLSTCFLHQFGLSPQNLHSYKRSNDYINGVVKGSLEANLVRNWLLHVFLLELK